MIHTVRPGRGRCLFPIGSDFGPCDLLSASNGPKIRRPAVLDSIPGLFARGCLIYLNNKPMPLPA